MPKKEKFGFKSVKIRVFTVTCGNCGVELYSRARHDYRTCPCGKTAVDGGFDYNKVSFDDKVGFTPGHRFIKATIRELYDDWNNHVNKFGIIQKCPSGKDGLTVKRPYKKDKPRKGKEPIGFPPHLLHTD